ncbi:hypothetical protein E4U43_004125, partial [Claviceps pusilla]
MKTRSSTRPRKPPPQTYSFQSSSPSASPPPSPPPAAAPPPPPPRHRRRRSSSSFSAPDSVPDTPPHLQDQDADPDPDQDEQATPSRPPRPSARLVKKKASTAAPAPAPAPATGKAKTKATSHPGTYLDVESVTTDTHLKGYTGPYDRSMRGQTLINTWYGPEAASIRALQAQLDRWMGWPVLPPKWVGCVEEGDDIELRGRRAVEHDHHQHHHFYQQHQQHQQQPQQQPQHQPKYIPLHGPARLPYQPPHLGIRLLMGPASPDPNPDPHPHPHPHPDTPLRQPERTMYPGDAIPLTQSWLPYHEDPSPKKLSTGWILDAGGIVTGMDWCPRRAGKQLLALAVVPHADQQNYHYESEHQRPGFQGHGTVQVWELEGEREGLRMEERGRAAQRPSSRMPRLRRTICMDFGRINRVRWCPEPGGGSKTTNGTVSSEHCMAVLCGDGRVCVVANDEGDDDASF